MSDPDKTPTESEIETLLEIPQRQAVRIVADARAAGIAKGRADCEAACSQRDRWMSRGIVYGWAIAVIAGAMGAIGYVLLR